MGRFRTLYTIIAGVLASAAAIMGCDKTDNDRPAPRVYVLGEYYYKKPCYWVDGEPVILERPEDLIYIHCNAIAIGVGNIYCGGEVFWRDSDKDPCACLWINGKISNWNMPRFSVCTAMSVSNGNLYSAGYIANGDRQGYYSVNGDISLISRQYGEASVCSAIVPYAGSVYVGGWHRPRNSQINKIACYWKDGVAVALETPEDSYETLCTSIAVSGSIVHAVGDYYQGVYPFEIRPCYWRNGKLVNLAAPGEARELCYSSVIVSGGNVYIGGSYVDKDRINPCYWVDGVLVGLSNPSGISTKCTSLAVVDGIVYAAGIIYPEDKWRGCYWIGTEYFVLEGSETESFKDYSITVAR